MAKSLTPKKAREILHDKSVHGHPLTDKQRRFFGAMSNMESGGWLDKYADGGNIVGPKAAPIRINGTEVFEHGEDTATADKEENGVNPTNLTKKGVKYAESVGQEALKRGKKAVITSDVQRAKETADVIGQTADLPVYNNPILRTWDIGEYDGAPEGSFKEKQWASKSSTPVPGGESFDSFKARMEKAFEFAETAPKDADIVTHSKVTRAFKALHDTDGKWTDKTTKKFLNIKNEAKAKEGVLLQKKQDNYGKQANYNDNQTSVGPGFVGMGNNLKGRDYSPAWGGQFQNGGGIPTDKRSQEFYNTLKDYYTAPDRTEAEKASYAAFQRLNEAHGYAPVAVKERTIAGKRSMINPFTGRLNLVAETDPNVGEIESTPQKLMEQYMNEYSHYQQYNEHPEESRLEKTGRFLGHMATDFGQMLKNTKGLNFGKAYDKNYFTPGTTEYEAHQVIQPKLQNEWANYYGQEWTKNRNKLQMGGSMPGAVGFTYARTAGAAPANGKYAKKTKASAQNGKEMSFYQQGLDFTPKTISKNGSVIKDDMGQWAHPGEVTEINSNNITMEGVDYPVLGVSDTGDTKLMQPDQNYKFKGKKVTEYPMAQTGITMGVESGTYQPTSKVATKEEIKAAKMQAMRDRQGYIKTAEPEESTLSRAWNIATHPMTALSYKIHGRDIPEHFERGEQNILEHATNIVNPFGYIDAAASIPGNLAKGEFINAGLNAATILPLLSEARGLPRTNLSSVQPIEGVVSKAGIPDPTGFVDAMFPKLDPLKLLGGQSDIMEFSPLNYLPGYGNKLGGNRQAFRKFGNSIQDVIERKALSPKGGSKFRLGRDQITNEGNWAAMGEPAENYQGVFEATFDLNHPESNLSAQHIPNRNGVLMMDKYGRPIVDIPLSEPSMSFNRRLPFSTRYVPIDKQKLINNQFQLATFAPHTQSLVEKYGLGLGVANLMGKGAVDTYNKYTIDPIINISNKIESDSTKKKSGGWLDKYKAQDGTEIPEGMTLPTVTVTSSKPSVWGHMKFAPYDPSKAETTISQWNPKPGEREALAAAEQARKDEANSWYNNKHIKAFRNSAFMDPTALGTATAAALLGPEIIAAAPYIAPALETPIAGVAGLTGTNILGAAAAYQGLENLPNTAQSVKTAYQNPTWNNIATATSDVAWNALDLAPVVSTVAKETKPFLGSKVSFNNSLQSVENSELPKLSIAEGNVLKNELPLNNQISRSELNAMIKRESDWLNSDEYLRRRMANTGETEAQVKAAVDKYHDKIKKTEIVVGDTKDPATYGYYNLGKTENPKIVIGEHLTRDEALATADHEIKHAMGQSSGFYEKSDIAAKYKNYPTIKVGNWFQRNVPGLGKVADHMVYLNKGEEQQVRALKLLDLIEESEGIPRGTQLTQKDLTSFVNKHKPGTEAGENFIKIHGDVNDLIQNVAKKYGKDVKNTPRKRLLDFLNKAYVLPGAAVVGGAGLINNESSNDKQKNGGWLDKYK
jgi:probable phosphoglycerate mutase